MGILDWLFGSYQTEDETFPDTPLGGDDAEPSSFDVASPSDMSDMLGADISAANDADDADLGDVDGDADSDTDGGDSDGEGDF